MQPHSNDATRELINGGANDTAHNVARGLESAGVPRDIAQTLGMGLVGAFILVAFFLFLKFFPWAGAKARPAAKKKKKGKKK